MAGLAMWKYKDLFDLHTMPSLHLSTLIGITKMDTMNPDVPLVVLPAS